MQLSSMFFLYLERLRDSYLVPSVHSWEAMAGKGRRHLLRGR